MDRFFKILDLVVSKQYLFKVKSCSDLNFFVDGCKIARYLYRQSDSEIDRFDGFQHYVSSFYNCSNQVKWGQIIDFYAKSKGESFPMFKKLLTSYLAENNKFDGNGGYALELKGLENFEQLILHLGNNYMKLGLESMDDFDKFYYGFFVYGDYDKGEAIFANLQDESFINFHEPEGNFKKVLVEEFKIYPVYDYVSILKYATTDEETLKTFFSIFKSYVKSLKRFE